MTGRIVRYFAATAALTFIGMSAASAGWYGDGCCGVPPAPPVNWGCASSGCAPLYTPPLANCCAPVRWGCGSSCGGYAGYAYGGFGNGGYGGYGYSGYGAYDDQPINVVNQGPSYDLPLTGYTYPVATYDQPRAYPYSPSYFGYRSIYRPGLRYGYRGVGYRGVGYRGYRYGAGYRYGGGRVGMNYGPRYGVRRGWR